MKKRHSRREERQKQFNGSWEGWKVFVTGCNGFLGSWVCRFLLESGAEVIGLIRDEMPHSMLNQSGDIGRIGVVRGCLEDYALMERAFNEFEIDACFHLAAQAIVGTASRLPFSTFESNLRGTYNVLEAARRYGKVRRLVVAASDKVYGTKEELPYTEEDALMGRHPYDVSKVCTDLLAQSYAHQYKLPIGIARSGNFYGPGDLNFSRIVPGTIRSLIRNENPIIRSDGTYVRDYFYIEDAAEAFIALGAALDRKQIQGEAFNFGTETPTTVREVVDQLIQISGKSGLPPDIRNEVTDEIHAQHLSCDKARRLLNWQSQTALGEGLRKAYRWYEKLLSQYEGQDAEFSAV